MLRTALCFLLPAALFGAYPYYSPAGWTPNGDTTFLSSGGSQIAAATVPAGENEYELRATLNIKASGGTFTFYLRASSDALTGPNAAGAYYAIELQNVQISGSSCIGTLAAYKRVGTTVSLLYQSAEACKDGMTWRIVRNSSAILFYNDLGFAASVPDSDIATGKPGYGARNLNTGEGFANAL